MDQLSVWLEQWKSVTAELVRALLLYLPNLIGAVLVLIIGWLVARLLRAATIKLLRGLDQILHRFLAPGGLVKIHLSDRVIRVIGNVVFWLIILIVLSLAAKLAKFYFLEIWLDRMIAYLPNLLAAGVIGFVGFLAGGVARDLVVVTFSVAGEEQSRLIGLVAQTAVVMLAIVIGLDQAGIDVAFLITVVAILLGAIAVSLALAFGFGAQGYVSNIIGAYQVQRSLKAGQVIRIGQHEGEIVEITPTGLVIGTRDGHVVVPGKLLIDQPIDIITPGVSDV
jgi:hypothetical protein